MSPLLVPVETRPQQRSLFPGEISISASSSWRTGQPETWQLLSLQVVLQHFNEGTRDLLGWRKDGSNRFRLGGWEVLFAKGEPMILNFKEGKQFSPSNEEDTRTLAELIGSEEGARELMAALYEVKRTTSYETLDQPSKWLRFARLSDYYTMILTIGSNMPAVADPPFNRQNFLTEHTMFWLEDRQVQEHLDYYASHGPRDAQTQEEYVAEVADLVALAEAGREWVSEAKAPTS